MAIDKERQKEILKQSKKADKAHRHVNKKSAKIDVVAKKLKSLRGMRDDALKQNEYRKAAKLNRKIERLAEKTKRM